MAKGHKLLKKVKSEKAKVKLKGSKQLPKGTNITDTSFKVKQIVVREQLRASDGSEPLSRRKLNLKELLTRLQHYNSTVRTDAITGLKELVSLYPDQVLTESLPQLLRGIAHLVLDSEKAVRRDGLKLMAMVLSPVPTENVSPFFDVPCSYLLCAMTHIDANIQEDSLLLLDIMLTCVPSLVAANSQKLLPSFFDLISKSYSNSKLCRTLTVNLGKKITGVKWRVSVLNRLCGILEAVISHRTQSKRKFTSSGSPADRVVHYDLQGHAHIPIYGRAVGADRKVQQLGLRDLASETNKGASEVDGAGGGATESADVVVPLLFSTWLEVGPDTRAANAGTHLERTLSEESAAVLGCCLRVLQLLWRLIAPNGDEAREMFANKCRRDFSEYVLKYFPFVRPEPKKRKRGDKDRLDAGADVNLMICHLFGTFNKRITNDGQKVYAIKTVKYVQGYLTRGDFGRPEDNGQLTLAVRTLLVDVSASWLNANVDTTSILDATVACCERPGLADRTRSDLFDVLCEIVHLPHLNKTSSFQIWQSKLVDTLLRPEIPEKVIDIVCLLAKQRNVLLTGAVLDRYPQLVGNLSSCRITQCSDGKRALARLAGVFYWIPVLFSGQHLETMRSLADGIADGTVRDQLLQLLELR